MAVPEAPQGKHIEVGGYKMYVIDVGSGEPIFFLHGGGPGADGWVDYGMVLPYFTDRRCILPDLLMFGKSDLVRHQEPVWSFHARHVDLLMEALGISRADFVCSSVGGSVALALAIEYPHRVRSIVLSGSNPTADMPGRPGGGAGPGAEWVARYYEGGPTWQKAHDLMAELEYWDPALLPEATVNHRFENTMRPEWLDFIADAANRGVRQNLDDRLGEITAPVLLLTGKYEVIAPPAYSLYLAEMIPGSEVYIMDRTRHHPEEERPADYSAIVRAFLGLSHQATGPFPAS